MYTNDSSIWGRERKHIKPVNDKVLGWVRQAGRRWQRLQEFQHQSNIQEYFYILLGFLVWVFQYQDFPFR